MGFEKAAGCDTFIGMKRKKSNRLFLFAGYDAAGRIDAAEIMYVRALTAFGDVVYVMDSDASSRDVAKIAKIPGVLHAAAKKHGEYDFGSYKRAYLYARDAGILGDYDYVYMVNNSVYAPLMDMGPIIDKMEAMDVDAFGPVIHPNSQETYIQSWFIGMRPSVFRTKWYDAFMSSVKHQADKGAVVYLYERGFTKQVVAHGLRFDGVYSVGGRAIYNDVKRLYKRGLPFMKRCAFNRHGGALGARVKYVMAHIDADAHDAIMDNARRVYGADYIDWMMTSNPIKIMWRTVKYAARKIFIEGI